MPLDVKAASIVRDPVYQQVHGLLRGLLQSGELQPGQRFPTERQIGERFGISRVTANKALAALVAEGALEFRKGVGTFVRDRGMRYELRSLMSFTRQAELEGKSPTTRVLQFKRVHASQCDPAAAAALSLSQRGELFYLERLRFADGKPMILERRYLAAQYCPKLTAKQLEGSLYTALTEGAGLRLEGAEQTLRAAVLNSKDARLLGLPHGSPTLWVRALGSCQHGPLWLEDTLYRGDLYAFHHTLGGLRAPPPRAQPPAKAAPIEPLQAPR